MKQDQIKYVRARAESILAQKQANLKRKHTTGAITLSNREKAQAIQDGEFTIDVEAASDDRYGNQWYGLIKFPAERYQSFDQDEYNKINAPLVVAYNKLLDELMLGDNTQALELLRAFEALSDS